MTVVMTRFSGRTFSTQGMRTVDSRVALRGPVPCAAEAVFAEAKAFLSSREARQMSASDLERELHRRHQELVGKLLQAHRDQRSPKEAAGPAEGASGVECPERREHECHTETTLRTVQVPRPDYASRGRDGPARFPPGATTRRRRRPRSAWRDFKFVLNQVTRAIEPPLPLARMISDWRTISGELAEPPRRRQPQLSAYFGWTEPLVEDHVA